MGPKCYICKASELCPYKPKTKEPTKSRKTLNNSQLNEESKVINEDDIIEEDKVMETDEIFGM